MSRPRTGTFIVAGAHTSGAARFQYRLRLGDGSRTERFDVPEGMSEAQARAFVAGVQAEEDAHGGLLARKREGARADAASNRAPHELETADDWHSRFLAARLEAKPSMYRANKEASYKWKRWAHRVIGSRPMAAATREQIETMRDAIDRAIASGELRAKTGQNAWSTITTAFKAAVNAKQRDLRVRTDNPCTDVLPPDDGPSRKKPWIYPSEFSALVACERVPLQWRECHAVACFTYLRPNELYELRWKDVSLDTGMILVRRAGIGTSKKSGT